MARRIVLSALVFIMSISLFGQDFGRDHKVWNTLYVSGKIGKRMVFDNSLINAFHLDGRGHWFTQNDFGLHYKFSRKYRVVLMYGMSFYQWRPSFADFYEGERSAIGTANFHRVAVMFNHYHTFNRHFRMKQSIGAQFYFPGFRKYQTRWVYQTRLTYRNKRWPMGLRPYVQGSLFYYLNGQAVEFFSEDAEGEEIVREEVPNGLHRYRIKVGISFKPSIRTDKLRFGIYYMLQREFNMGGLGNDLNVVDPEDPGSIINPFSNYSVIGTSISLFL